MRRLLLILIATVLIWDLALPTVEAEATRPAVDSPVAARAHGVVCDGSTDDSAALTALIDSVGTERTAPTTGTPYREYPAPCIQLPAGICRIDSVITIARHGVCLQGMGRDRTLLWPSRGTTAIEADADPATDRAPGGDSDHAPLRDLILRDFSITYDNTNRTAGGAAPADTVAIVLDQPFRPLLENITVEFDVNNTTAGLVAFRLYDPEPFILRNLEADNVAGAADGNPGIGLDIRNPTDNRGNGYIESFFCRKCQVGVRLSSANLLNSLVFDALKVVNLSSGAAAGGVDRAFRHGVWIDQSAGGSVTNVVFNAPHIEGERDDGADARSFENCFYLDGSRGSISQIRINAPLISRCIDGFDLRGANVDSVAISDTLVAAADNTGVAGAYNFDGTEGGGAVFRVGSSSATDIRIVGATGPSTGTVATWSDLPVSSTSQNYYAWSAGAGRTPLMQSQLRAHSFGVGVGRSTVIRQASGTDAGEDCTGTCTSGSLCMDIDGDGTMNCDGDECHLAVCQAGAWNYGYMGSGGADEARPCSMQADTTLDIAGCSVVSLTGEAAGYRTTTTLTPCGNAEEGTRVTFVSNPGGTAGYGAFSETGNMRLSKAWAPVAANAVLDLICVGSVWCEVSRSEN